MLSQITLDDGSLVRNIGLLVVEEAVGCARTKRELASVASILVEGHTLLLRLRTILFVQLFIVNILSGSRVLTTQLITSL